MWLNSIDREVALAVVFKDFDLSDDNVTGELWEPGERAGRGRGGAAGGLRAGVRSGAAGKLVASGRAASGNGHSR